MVAMFLAWLCIGTAVLLSFSDANVIHEKAVDVSQLRPTQFSKDHLSQSCEIPANSGHYTGVCANDVGKLREQLTFCKDVVLYRACVPPHQPLWDSWTVKEKDALIGRLFKKAVEARMTREMNRTPNSYVHVRLTTNPECVTAFKNALCWYNFPKCGNFNESLPLCESSCESYFKGCGYTVGSDGTFQTHDMDVEGEKFGLCSPARTSLDGVFASGVTGPDQMYGPKQINCNRTMGPAQQMWEADRATEDFSWVIVPAVIFVLVIISIFLLFKLKAWINDQDWERKLAPIKAKLGPKLAPLEERLQEFPLDCVSFCVLLSVGAILGVFIFGVYSHMTADRGALERFAPTTQEEAEAAGPHVSPAFSWPQLQKVKLSKQALVELDGCCTCTGDVARSSCSWLLLCLLLLAFPVVD